MPFFLSTAAMIKPLSAASPAAGVDSWELEQQSLGNGCQLQPSLWSDIWDSFEYFLK